MFMVWKGCTSLYTIVPKATSLFCSATASDAPYHALLTRRQKTNDLLLATTDRESVMELALSLKKMRTLGHEMLNRILGS
jgi:hypothetical protein